MEIRSRYFPPVLRISFASQSGNTNFLAAAPVTRALTVINKLDQSITFTTVTPKTVGDGAFTLSATATSALPIQFSTTSDKIMLAGSTVTILKAGSVTVTAGQEGNATYKAAPGASQTFCINPAKPSITLSGADSEIFFSFHLLRKAINGF